jgi:flagellar protein FliO/FliZ
MRYSPAAPTVASYTGYLIETFATLVGVCALAFIVLWGARRLGVGRATGAIELYGHLPLDSRRSIYLVKVGARVFVVGVGEGGFTKLGDLAADELPAPPATNGLRFADVLARTRARSPGTGANDAASTASDSAERGSP